MSSRFLTAMQGKGSFCPRGYSSYFWVKLEDDVLKEVYLPMRDIQDFSLTVIENVEQVIVGNRAAIELLLVAILCNGHVLIEDVPGVGKTMMARALAVSLGGSFKRLQCTPDLMPNDITGVSIFNQQTRAFDFRPGPIFVNILLADEINRATPRTQSALLEAMQEQQVTVDGVSRPLPDPFLIMATQNPIEYEGTFPLPEAQLDRFLLRVAIGYPALEQEKQILRNLRREHPILKIHPVVDSQEILAYQEAVWDVYIDPTLEDYIVRLTQATREHPDLALGASPRGSLALYKASQALAALKGRDHVLPDDIKHLVPMAIGHRLILRTEAQLRGKTTAAVLNDLLEKVSLDIGSLDE
jgi:MoxR-like ATPase